MTGRRDIESPRFEVPLRWPAVLLLFLVGLCLDDAEAQVPRVDCEGADISVQAGTRLEALAVCAIVGKALPQLSACHLPLISPVKIIVADDLPDAPENCLGYYQCDQGEVHLRSAAGMARAIARTSAFSELDKGVFFESIVVHELAHALFDQNACASERCAENHEYVAHAMQMAWLPAEERAKIVVAYPVEPPVDPSLLNGLIAAMAPDRYAAIVWQHFAGPENGCGFVGRLVTGETSLQLFAE